MTGQDYQSSRGEIERNPFDDIQEYRSQRSGLGFPLNGRVTISKRGLSEYFAGSPVVESNVEVVEKVKESIREEIGKSILEKRI